MAIAEIPHSVRVSPPNPDTASLSLNIDGIKITEPQGQKIKKKDEIPERKFLLNNHENKTSVTYHSSEELDQLVFHPHEKRSSHYVARNGVYIQIGALTDLGEAKVQYDINDGHILAAQADLDSVCTLEAPTNVDLSMIKDIVDLFSNLKNPATPIPTDLSQMSDSILATIQFSESYQQQALFEI